MTSCFNLNFKLKLSASRYACYGLPRHRDASFVLVLSTAFTRLSQAHFYPLPTCSSVPWHNQLRTTATRTTWTVMQGFDNQASNDWQLCACGRAFSQPSASSNHKRTCTKTKKRLASALGRAKERWLGNKRHRGNLAESSTGKSTPVMHGLARAPSLGPTQDTEETVCNQIIST